MRLVRRIRLAHSEPSRCRYACMPFMRYAAHSYCGLRCWYILLWFVEPATHMAKNFLYLRLVGPAHFTPQCIDSRSVGWVYHITGFGSHGQTLSAISHKLLP